MAGLWTRCACGLHARAHAERPAGHRHPPRVGGVSARLLLFDIDGTLVLTGGAGQRAMARAFEELFGVADAFAERVDGRPHRPLAGGVGARAAWCRRHRPSALERLPRSAIWRCSTQAIGEAGPRATRRHARRARRAGPARSASSARTWRCSPATTRDGARIKLEHFGLWDRFAWGAFGDDHAERDALARAAVADAAGPRHRARRPGARGRRRRHALRHRLRPRRRRARGRRGHRRAQPRRTARLRARPRARGPARRRRRWSRSSRTRRMRRAPSCRRAPRYDPRWKRTGPGGPPGLQNRSLRSLRAGWVRLPGASANRVRLALKRLGVRHGGVARRARLAGHDSDSTRLRVTRGWHAASPCELAWASGPGGSAFGLAAYSRLPLTPGTRRPCGP